MSKKKNNSKLTSLRIIAGSHRGRKIPIVEEPGLRPTGDRMRETLFNWLSPYIEGASVLDAFAGSGILAFESLSRGAKNAVILDSSSLAAKQLNQSAESLDMQADIQRQNALEFFLANSSTDEQKFDVVFLDPPFDTPLLQQSLDLLDQSTLLRSSALIYIEWSRSQPQPTVPLSWVQHKEKTMGEVNCAIYQIPAG